MRLLRAVLIAKIVGTAVLFVLPLLALPTDCLRQLLGADMAPLVARLLGWSYLSILFGYAGGLMEARRGIFPNVTVYMGLASNGGAAVLLGIHVLNTSGASAPGAIGGLIFTASVALALGICWLGRRLTQ